MPQTAGHRICYEALVTRFFRASSLSALAAVLVSVMAHRAAIAAEQCWTPAELSARPREEEIQRHMAAAYRPVSRVTPRPVAASVPPLKGGVLRRVNLPAGKKLVAFTFDLCEQPFEISGYQGDIFDFLRANGVRATIFAGGKWLETHPERAQQLMADPLFEIGSHAWEHRNFRVVPRQVRLDEIDGAIAAYDRVVRSLEQRACLTRNGQLAHLVPPARQTLFRFPFGACTSQAMDDVRSRGQLAVQWDVSSADPWPGQTASGMVASVSKRIRPGSIVLFHANGRGFNTASALPELIKILRAQSYEFVTVSELLATPGAVPEVSRDCYDFKPNDVNRYDGIARQIETASDAFFKRFAPERLTEISAQREGSEANSTLPAAPAAATAAMVAPAVERVAPDGTKLRARPGATPSASSWNVTTERGAGSRDRVPPPTQVVRHPIAPRPSPLRSLVPHSNPISPNPSP